MDVLESKVDEGIATRVAGHLYSCLGQKLRLKFKPRTFAHSKHIASGDRHGIGVGRCHSSVQFIARYSSRFCNLKPLFFSNVAMIALTYLIRPSAYFPSRYKSRD